MPLNLSFGWQYNMKEPKGLTYTEYQPGDLKSSVNSLIQWRRQWHQASHLVVLFPISSSEYEDSMDRIIYSDELFWKQQVLKSGSFY